MTEHFEALEASFQSTYRLDLRFALWGPPDRRIGVRRLVSLIQGLPPRSPLHRSLNPGAADWGPLEELLATNAELLDTANRMFWEANFKGHPPGKPIQITRPTVKGRKMPRVKVGEGETIRDVLEREGRLLKPGSLRERFRRRRRRGEGHDDG